MAQVGIANKPLTIYASVDRDGTTFALSPRAQRDIRRELGDVAHLRSRIFVSHATNYDHEDIHGSIHPQIIQLLTGLTVQRLSELGHDVCIRDAVTDEDVTSWG